MTAQIAGPKCLASLVDQAKILECAPRRDIGSGASVGAPRVAPYECGAHGQDGGGTEQRENQDLRSR